MQRKCTRKQLHSYLYLYLYLNVSNSIFTKVQAGVIEVLPGVFRHFDQLYIGGDLLFVTFTSPFCMAPANSFVLYGAPVILGFTPAGPREFLNAEKFFKFQTKHSVFWGAVCLMC